MTTQYLIKSGDTLSQIAQQNKTTVADLMKLNPNITDPNKIYAGQSLSLSGEIGKVEYIQDPSNPYASIPKPITPTTITPTTGTDNAKAPIVNANVSDLNAQIEMVKAQIEQKTKELETAKAEEAKGGGEGGGDTGNGGDTGAGDDQSKWDKMWEALLGKQQEIQDQAIKSQQDLLTQQTAIYEQWGITPENFQKIQDIIPQITDYQKQMAALDTRELQAVDAIQNRPGVDLAFASGETARIQRAYAIQKSGIAAQASILASQAQALQGNWDTAVKAAQLYVDNATKAQQQVVSDLKWGFENYTDIISAMSAEEQAKIKLAMDAQQDELDRQQKDYWNQVDADMKQQGLELDWYKATQKTPTAPTTKEVGGVLYQWDPTTGNWSPAVGIGEVDTRKYIQDPTNPTASIINPNYGQPIDTEQIKTLTGKPLTDSQALSLGYGKRMVDANVIISELEDQFTGAIGIITGWKYFPGIFKTEDRLRIEQAERNFINAVLRRESGAAIAPSEFDSAAKQYFPQPGDTDKVLKQKAKNRQTVISNMAISANVPLSEVTGQEVTPTGGGSYEDYLKAIQ